MKKGKENTRCS